MNVSYSYLEVLPIKLPHTQDKYLQNFNKCNIFKEGMGKLWLEMRLNNNVG